MSVGGKRIKVDSCRYDPAPRLAGQSGVCSASRPKADTTQMDPDTRYATTPDGVYIAYQVAGEGPVDVAWQFPFLGNVDLLWEAPVFGTLLRGIASFARLILHDRRGTGLSSRNVPPPDLETRVADLRVVLDAVGSERPVLGGLLEGGAAERASRREQSRAGSIHRLVGPCGAKRLEP